jgi:flagellar biosynthesis/type III secretory pathway chaperone
MLDAYNDLVEVLEDEIKVYRTLLDTVRREKDVLITANIDELNENNKTKDLIISRIRLLERHREKCAKDLAESVGTNTENPRLLEIAFKTGEPYSTRLRSIHATLELLIRRIKEINDSNEELVRSSLRAVNGALGAIKDTLQPKSTYASSGDLKRAESSGRFVSKDA